MAQPRRINADNAIAADPLDHGVSQRPDIAAEPRTEGAPTRVGWNGRHAIGSVLVS
jgi:hypothetical protein